MIKQFESVGVNEIPKVANFIIELLPQNPIILLKGEMGAGKTTLVSSILKQLQGNDEASSPTFSIVNHYESILGAINHFDLYRLKNLDEALEIGIEEYLYSGEICLIEWHQIIEPLLDEAICVEIEKVDEKLRTFRIFNPN